MAYRQEFISEGAYKRGAAGGGAETWDAKGVEGEGYGEEVTLSSADLRVWGSVVELSTVVVKVDIKVINASLTQNQ